MTAIDYQVRELLEQAGAHIRGRNRADCPQCKRFRAISFTPETFFCHGCAWSGNTFTLERELGIQDQRSDAERKADRQARERARDAALALYGAVKVRRLELLDRLHDLNRQEIFAHDAGPDDPVTWETLALVYSQRPAVEQELDLLDQESAADAFRELCGQPNTTGGPKTG